MHAAQSLRSMLARRAPPPSKLPHAAAPRDSCDYVGDGCDRNVCCIIARAWEEQSEERRSAVTANRTFDTGKKAAGVATGQVVKFGRRGGVGEGANSMPFPQVVGW